MNNVQVMQEFVDTYKKQESLKMVEESMPITEYFETWFDYECALLTKAKTIKKGNYLKDSCKAYPEYKNILETYIALL